MIWAMDHPPTDPHDPTTPHPAPLRRPDPGSGVSRLLAVLCALVFASLAILWQNLPPETQYDLLRISPPKAPENAPAISSVSQVNLLGRVYIRMDKLTERMGAGASSAPNADLGVTSMQFIDQSVFTAPEAVAAAIAAAELLDDPQEALDRLASVGQEQRELLNEARNRLAAEPPEESDREALEQSIAQYEKVLLDVDHVSAIYRGEGEGLTPEQRERLVTRYDYFGRLANTYALDDTDPARAPLLSGGGAIIAVLLLIALLILVVFITGLVLLLLGVIKLSSGRMVMRFEPPAPGGSVFLEVYALFVAGFLVMTVGATALSSKDEALASLLSLVVQWSLLLVPFWPLLRGMKGPAFRQAIGLHRGRGLVREIGAGITAYIASVPVFFFGVLLTVVIMFIAESIRVASGQGPGPVPENPVIDIVSQADPVVLFLIFLLATVWAPLTEELVFRGALYRWFRGRLVWPLSAFLVGLLFAFMHSYGPLMVSPLVALGFMFSFMREWRGSIIACMTAHFIHNFSVFAIAGTVIYLLA